MIEIDVVVILFLVAFLAGVVDAIAGGGGLITLPALFIAGLDPITALATNKLQGSFGSGSAMLSYARRGYIRFNQARLMVLTTFIASVMGVIAISFVPTQWLTILTPLLLMGLALYFLCAKRLSDHDTAARISQTTYARLIAPMIGFYDGIFGPGAGSFYLLSQVTLLGQNIRSASAYTKLLNFASNLGALSMFAVSGKIIWLLGLTMGAGQFLGAKLGAHLAIKNGAALIRPLLVLVCCAMAIKLLAARDHPIWLFLSQ